MSRPLRCPAVVGRRAQQDLLAAAVDEAAQGRGATVVLVAEAGIGKSSLARWCLTRSGGPRLAGRAVPPPATDLRALAELSLTAVQAGVDPWAPERELYRSALRALLPGAGGRPDVTEVDALLLGHAVLDLVVAVPGDGPRVAVLEDVHWADDQTLRALDHLVDLVPEHRALLLVTARSGESTRVDELLDRWAARRVVQLVPLQPLTDTDAREMVARCLGGTPPGRLTEALLPIAEGSPLLVEELLDTLVDAGHLVAEDGGWAYRPTGRVGIPRTFAAAVGRQLAALDPADRRVLQSSALVSREIDPDLLMRMGHREDEVDRAVGAGIAARLLAVDTELRGDVVFRHALTRTAVVDHLLPHERRALACANLQQLERDGIDPADLGVAAGLAGHAGDTGRQAAYLVVAARHAVAVGNPAAALAKLDAAAPLAAHDLGRQREVETVRIEALSQSGDVVGTRRLAHQLVPELQRSGDHDALVRCRLALARAEGACGNWEQARSALPDLEADGVPPEALSLGAVVAMETAAVEEAARLADRARRAAAAAGSGIAECEALEVLGRLARIRSYDDAAAVFADGVRAAERHGLRLWRARALLELGLCDATRTRDGANFERARDAAVDAGAIGFSAMVDYNLAHLYGSGFDQERAMACAQRGLAAARRLRLPSWEARHHIMIGHAHAAAGRRGEARAAGAAAVAAEPGDGEVAALDWGVCRGFASLVAEDREAAVVEYARCLDLFEALDFRSATMPWYDLPIVGAVGDPDGLGRRALAAVEAPEIRGAVGDWLPLAEAVLAGRAGDGARATALVDGVLARAGERMVHGRWGRVDLWLRLIGEVALAGGWGRPVEWLTEAEAHLRARGVTTVADACRGLLRDAGAPPRPRAAAGVPAELQTLGITPREVEILRLLTRRLTNRQIADRLLVSPRTVKTHVEHLLAKTGRSDRHELAEFARASGQAEAD